MPTKLGLYYLPEDGVALQMRRGALAARGADGAARLFEPRVHGLRTILLAGHGASISSEAIRWCAREGVSLYVAERNGECMALFANATFADGRRKALHLRQKQFAAVLDPRKRLEIARKIILAKLRTLELHSRDAKALRAKLVLARTLNDILTVEAGAGAAYFMRWRGIEMRFNKDAPQHWRVFNTRSGSFLRGKSGMSPARHSATPVGACLNYAFAIALGQCTRAIIGMGLDACVGFLRSPKPGRLSLSYDALELHRARVTRAVFNYVQGRAFKRSDFQLSPEGIVRLSPLVAKEVVALVLKEISFKDYVAGTRKIVKWF